MSLGIKEKAAIGLAVPLGILLILAFAGLIYANQAKKKRIARGDVELAVDPNAPKPKEIKWNPYM